MATVERKVLLRGRAVRAAGVNPAVAGAALVRLETALHGAVDVAFRGSSAAGRRRPWLREAGRADWRAAEKTGAEEMALYFEVPRLGDVAHEFYAQPSLFEAQPDADDTAFDVLGDAVADVLAGKADSDRFDVGLLKRFHRFDAAVLDRQVDELLIVGQRRAPGHVSRISTDFTERAKGLYLQTPAPGRVRVAGRLDMIEASTLTFALRLGDGQRVRGVWKGEVFETLRSLAGGDVAVTGMAVYRPSGRLLRIDADVMAEQSAADAIFAALPVPSGRTLDVKSLLREQRDRGGVAAVWGRISAEESDGDFLSAIGQMG